MSKRDEVSTEPPKRGGGDEAGGEEHSGRRSAAEETDRLTNMATAIGAGVSIVPVPGTSAVLSSMELLMIVAIAKIWGHPMSSTFLAGMLRSLASRLAVGVGMALAADAVGWIPGIGTLVKPAVNAGVIKLVGASMRDYMLKENDGRDPPAEITAEEARDALQRAMARVAAYAPDLKDGAKDAFKGDAKKLAKTLRAIFGDD